MIQFSGHFDGTAITPDEPVEIPLNIPLRITIEPETEKSSRGVDWNRLLQLANECAIDGPVDLAEHHDHYAHGKPVE